MNVLANLWQWCRGHYAPSTSRVAAILNPVSLAPSGLTLVHTPEPALKQEEFADARTQAEDRVAMQAQLVRCVKNGTVIPQELLKALGIRTIEGWVPPRIELKAATYGVDSDAYAISRARGYL